MPILVSVIHTDNGDSPNTGSNLHLSNQVGQPDFKLGGNLFLRNTGPTDFSGTLTFTQSLLGAADAVVATSTKDAPVTIAAGKSVDLLPGSVGSIPMQGVDTKGTSYRYRLTVKNGAETISDTVTGLAFDITNTTFTTEATPYALTAASNANDAIKSEIALNDIELAKLPIEISTKQARLAKLTARNTALKSAVPL